MRQVRVQIAGNCVRLQRFSILDLNSINITPYPSPSMRLRAHSGRSLSMSEMFDYTLDPDGDTKIILQNPSAPFAGECAEHQQKAPNSKDGCQLNNDKNYRREPNVVTFRASSRHLSLASERSRRMKSQAWVGEKVEADGFIHLECDEWSSMALLIVLNIIHCRSRQVPRTVTLDMLVKIATIVDYFEFQEAVEPYSTGWIKSLRQSCIQATDGDLVLLIWVSHVFGNEAMLSNCQAAAALRSRNRLDDLGLPIPCSILGKLVDFYLL